MKKISLVLLKARQKGKIAEISGGAALEQRLMSMGIYGGVEITKMSHFALKGAVTIKVGRGVVALGHSMAAKIMIEAE